MSVSTTDKTASPKTKLISGIKEIADQYDHFILDMYGVVHDGIYAFEGTLPTLQALKDAGKKICMLSNSPRRAESANTQMGEKGIPRHYYDHCMTSGESTFHALKNKIDAFHESCGKNCLFFANPNLLEMIDGLDLNLVDNAQEATFILNATPESDPRGKGWVRQQLALAAKKNLPMICSNPDLIVHIGENLMECCGTFAKEYEEMGGHVIYHGKPYAPVYERCYELLGKPDKSRVIMVGDNLRTDIKGAKDFGIESIFNLTSVHKNEFEDKEQPNKIDMNRVQKTAQQYGQSPTYAINGFNW